MNQFDNRLYCSTCRVNVELAWQSRNRQSDKLYHACITNETSNVSELDRLKARCMIGRVLVSQFQNNL
jgi:hypothetical protein